MKTVACGKVSRSYTTTLHRYLVACTRRFVNLLLFLVCSIPFCAVAQTARSNAAFIPSGRATVEALPFPLRSAVKIALLDNHDVVRSGSNYPIVIVIGFVGGFVRSDDQKHPEVHFAESLREHYRSNIHAEVFGNHHGRKALHEVLRMLDTDGDGTLSTVEKEHARIVIYGHSWGAAETVMLARYLGRRDILVLLTIQMDSIAKLGRDDSKIPSNVADAINFYQSGGPLHGRAQIFAADPDHTNIIGNFHMTYKNHPIKCDNYPWYARTFNKPHHEIENDPRVWNHAALLIDSEVVGATLQPREALPEGHLLK
jgi:pimeloyl-ACP methyl ester carboxylesterase